MSQRKLILSMQITLDGYVAGPDNDADWLLNTDEEWADLFNDIDGADTYLVGRKAYHDYSKYWQSVLHKPDSDKNELRFAKVADKSQHIVFTKGDFKPDWKNTRVAHDPVEEVARLKKEEGKNIIAWGGADFASNLIELDLVDEYRLALNPTLLTDGKMLYENLQKRKKLKLISAKPLKSGMVILRYEPGATHNKSDTKVKSLQAETH